jgi:hypothetical protein
MRNIEREPLFHISDGATTDHEIAALVVTYCLIVARSAADPQHPRAVNRQCAWSRGGESPQSWQSGDSAFSSNT